MGYTLMTLGPAGQSGASSEFGETWQQQRKIDLLNLGS